jgi:tryptophanyl-tRNA synthetase
MYTDPKKLRANDPGHPDGCVVFALHKIYNPTVEERAAECRDGRIGCVACKKHLLSLMEPLKEIQERRAVLAQKPGWVREILEEGTRAARRVARATLDEAKAAMGLP